MLTYISIILLVIFGWVISGLRRYNEELRARIRSLEAMLNEKKQ